ncbi:DUF4238 domain-containing protein [Rhizobium sp. 21-4511-3d]
MSQRSKNHHYVPQVLQRRFAVSKQEIWHSRRGEDGLFEAPKLRLIDKTFKLRNYYTVEVDGVSSDVVERRFYGPIDDYLGKVLPEVFESFDRGVVPTFSGRALTSLQRVVLEMTKRTPDFVAAYVDETKGREFVEELLADTSGELLDEDRVVLQKELGNAARLREYGRQIRVTATVRESDDVHEALVPFQARWVMSRGTHSYILTSRMAMRIGNGGHNGLANPDAEIWMPVSPKVCLVLVRDAGRKIPLRVDDSTANIRQFNEYAASVSREIASHSPELLESLTGKKRIEPSLVRETS